MKSIFFLLFILSCTHLQDKNEDNLLVRCGYLLDPVNMVWVKDQIVLIRNGKVIELNPAAIPPGIRKIDYSTNYIIPGLVDAHSHVFLNDPTMGDDFSKGLLAFLNKTKKEERLKLGESRLNSLAWSGFTTVRDLGNMGTIRRDELPKSGANIFSSGAGYTPGNGQFPPGIKDSFGEYLQLKENFPEAFSFDLVKLYADEEPNHVFADQEIFTEWVKAAHAKGLNVSAHAILKQGIRIAIAGNADTLEHGTEITASGLHEMKKKGIIFVPTYAEVLFLRPELKKFKTANIVEVTAKTCHNIRTASRMGVRIAFGSDNYFSLEENKISFGEGTLEILLAYRKCGLSPMEILKIATANGAETISSSHPSGKVIVGSSADFIVLGENPGKNLEELRRPVAVYLKGQKIR